MKARTAIVTGATGQDGWHLGRLLSEQGYRVVGTTRGSDTARNESFSSVELTSWDLRDDQPIRELIDRIRPDEIYNLAAYSSGAGMFEDPVGMGDVNGLAVTKILEAIRLINPSTRFCQASSSEMFGEPMVSPQSEETAFHPRSPYGAAKLYAHEMIGIYRRRYDLFACSAILFNHESPRRGLGFVTRKISDGAARIRLGLADELVLGNLEARRDWGFSGDFMQGAWMMLQAPVADDYVLATGQTHSVRDLCHLAFEHVGLDYREFVREDAAAFRPSEPVPLVGDASRAASRLNWSPRTTFPELVRSMVDADLQRLKAVSRHEDQA
jgi:GDPmannose 4,6-dehydratase